MDSDNEDSAASDRDSRDEQDESDDDQRASPLSPGHFIASIPTSYPERIEQQSGSPGSRFPDIWELTLRETGTDVYVNKKPELDRSLDLQRLGNRLGRGPLGPVYHANIWTEGPTSRTVVVKCIALNKFKNTRMIAHSLKELKKIRHLSHLNVIKYEGAVKKAGWLNIVLEQVFTVLSSLNELIMKPFFRYIDKGSLFEALDVVDERLAARYTIQIVDALHYLHSKNIGHYHLNPYNIFLTSTGIIKLSGFGLYQIHFSILYEHLSGARLDDERYTPINWTAPEILRLQRPSRESDIWSLACIIITLITGSSPYSDTLPVTVGMSTPFPPTLFAQKILEDVAPIPSSCSPHLQSFLKSCLNKDRAERPTAETLAQHPWLVDNGAFPKIPMEVTPLDLGRDDGQDRQATPCDIEVDIASVEDAKERVTSLLSDIFKTVEPYKRLMSCTEEDTQEALNLFQLLLDAEAFQDRKQLIAAMRRLSERSGLHPTQFSLSIHSPTLEDEPVASGSFADIYKIMWRGEEMCHKVIRVYQRSQIVHLAKVYAREAILWAQLSHPNILPFYGLVKFRSRLSFVSRWASNGNLEEYLASCPDANRILLCLDTAAGISYLHENEIVHGDLKAMNVLIDKSGRACLGDFGLSSVNDPQILKWTSQSTMVSRGGTTRWQAPELIESEDTAEGVCNTTASDVYAWASVCYEIFTGRLPFFEASNYASVALCIIRGEIPTKPHDDDPAWVKHGLNDRIWDLMKDCWCFKPSDRPDIATVISRFGVDAPVDLREPGEWTEKEAMRFRNVNASESDTGLEISRDPLGFWKRLESLLLSLYEIE
ncbi:hypothetical protein H0H93_012851 [Arthromyces matolae]|nr:hypothetical protein H0H93_012851 [Arthromyces matolae]